MTAALFFMPWSVVIVPSWWIHLSSLPLPRTAPITGPGLRLVNEQIHLDKVPT